MIKIYCYQKRNHNFPRDCSSNLKGDCCRLKKFSKKWLHFSWMYRVFNISPRESTYTYWTRENPLENLAASFGSQIQRHKIIRSRSFQTHFTLPKRKISFAIFLSMFSCFFFSESETQRTCLFSSGNKWSNNQSEFGEWLGKLIPKKKWVNEVIESWCSYCTSSLDRAHSKWWRYSDLSEGTMKN